MIQVISKDELNAMPVMEQQPLLVMEYGDRYIICTMDEYTYMTNDIESYAERIQAEMTTDGRSAQRGSAVFVVQGAERPDWQGVPPGGRSINRPSAVHDWAAVP